MRMSSVRVRPPASGDFRQHSKLRAPPFHHGGASKLSRPNGSPSSRLTTSCPSSRPVESGIRAHGGGGVVLRLDPAVHMTASRLNDLESNPSDFYSLGFTNTALTVR